jgi:hypothetical protein
VRACLPCKSGKLPQMDAALTRLAAIDIGDSIRTGVAPLSRTSPLGGSRTWCDVRLESVMRSKSDVD